MNVMTVISEAKWEKPILLRIPVRKVRKSVARNLLVVRTLAKLNVESYL